MSILVDCIDTCLGLSHLEDSEAGPLSLRICVNLANNNEQISGHFARSTFVGKLMNLIQAGLETLSSKGCEDDNARQLDMLVLAEGALFNLAEMSDEAREIAAEDFSVRSAPWSNTSKLGEVDPLKPIRSMLPERIFHMAGLLFCLEICARTKEPGIASGSNCRISV